MDFFPASFCWQFMACFFHALIDKTKRIVRPMVLSRKEADGLALRVRRTRAVMSFPSLHCQNTSVQTMGIKFDVFIFEFSDCFSVNIN